ncbi:MAG TPA: cob(I)yrinic acid a,c-diamide adenosyltransferase [Nitrospiria bacterium]|nr:cob(I)yrinic acid a,c-diamide adenosyltransferase [Nitrospiria bacterium]
MAGPQTAPPLGGSRRKGLIIVHTGDGKGKTTAALGLALRAVGHGWRVLMVQFIKGSWQYGELEAAKRLAPDLTIQPMGEGFTWDTKDPARDAAKARACWEAGVAAARSGQYQMVIFDEINYAIAYGYLPLQEVLDFLAAKPADVHVVLTGRDAPKELIAVADTVTEMRAIKHAFEQGVKAQKGIEF